MKWPLIFTILVLFLSCSETIAAPLREFERQSDAVATVNKREEPSATTTAAAATTDNASTTTTSSSTTTTDTKKAKTTTATDSNTASSTTSDATSVATTVPSLDTSAASGGSSQNSTKSLYTGGLPLQPDLSPALGVGGFILLVSGAALALIGIRKRWLYISLSTAFLAALGVTVLIEYVMNPPVTNAVQGGYLVAVVVTGAVFGGLALVFKEITEGLSCLLGGFCIGMWLMTVKAGGLVTENGAKVGFIIAFSAGFYCLSFSHYTRSYGSMVCTAFSGATALVLGIDCFSRAGLKEFWLYVWGLNDNMFPLNTTTYPVTRNIRVELAITIIVTIFGVIAQMRLWKVIKERRANEESSRKEEERKKEEADAEAGRQLEEKNQRERAEWEQTYGNGSAKTPSMTETAVNEESRRGSDGFNSSNNDTEKSIEMKDMASPDGNGGSDCENNLDAVEETSEQGEHGEQDGADAQDGSDLPSVGDRPERPFTPPPEKAFRVNANVRDDESENGAIVGSEVGTPRSKRFSGMSFKNRLSWRSGNGAKTNHQSESEEALVAHNDATSSVAGIVDDVQTISSRRSSLASETRREMEDAPQPPTEPTEKEKSLPKRDILQEASANEHNSQSHQPSEPIDTVDSPALHKEVQVEKNEAVTAATETNDQQKIEKQQPISDEKVTPEPKSNEVSTEKIVKTETIEEKSNIQAIQVESQKAEITSSQEKNSEGNAKEISSDKQSIKAPVPVENTEDTTPEPQQPKVEKKPEVKPTPQPVSTPQPAPIPQPAPVPVKKPVKPKLDMSTVNRIPEQTSKVVHTFRTNEWAKHLADADTPELEPLEYDYEQALEATQVEEPSAPVNVDELLQTPLNAQPPPAVTSPVETLTSPDEARRRSRLSMAPAAEIPQTKNRNSTQRMPGAKSPPISRNVSSASLVPQQPEVDDGLGQLRSPSAPLLTLTTPNNAQGNEKEQAESPRWSGPPPLLAVRENMMRNRMSSTSLRYDPWASRNASRQSLVDPGRVISPPLSIPDEGDEEPARVNSPPHDDDDVPLSRRRAMLQQQTLESPSTTSLHGFDRARSPPISPVNNAKPAATMAAWRQSVREDISSRRDPLSLNSTTTTPTSPERPHSSLWGSVQQMKEASTARVDDAIAEGMQRGSMTDLHRQAMRRMQASANRKL